MNRKAYKKWILRIIAIVLLIGGLSIILYPDICRYQYKLRARQVINDYETRMEVYNKYTENNEYNENAGSDEWYWLYDMMVKYNEKLYESGQSALIDAFSYQQIDFSLKQFGFDEEMIGYLTIPRMDVELPIYLGANTENMSKGAAHLTQTSLPVGGLNTNAVIAAHRGYGGVAMFREIETMEIGDSVMITNFREKLLYRVSEIKVIDPSDIDQILIQDGRDLVTLITCHPYRHNYQRYVIYCERVAVPEDEVDEVMDTGSVSLITQVFNFSSLSSSQKEILIERLSAGVIVAVLLIFLIVWLFVRKRKK